MVISVGGHRTQGVPVEVPAVSFILCRVAYYVLVRTKCALKFLIMLRSIWHTRLSFFGDCRRSPDHSHLVSAGFRNQSPKALPNRLKHLICSAGKEVLLWNSYRLGLFHKFMFSCCLKGFFGTVTLNRRCLTIAVRFRRLMQVIRVCQLRPLNTMWLLIWNRLRVGGHKCGGRTLKIYRPENDVHEAIRKVMSFRRYCFFLYDRQRWIRSRSWFGFRNRWCFF